MLMWSPIQPVIGPPIGVEPKNATDCNANNLLLISGDVFC
jgi:hypothetical protein